MRTYIKNKINLLFRAIKIRKNRRVQPKNTLAVFYDLSVHPASFDFVAFLAGAEQHRIEKGLERMSVYLVPGPIEGFRSHKNLEQNQLGNANQEWRLQNIVIPACYLFEACRSVGICPSRAMYKAIVNESASTYPKGYNILRPKYFSGISGSMIGDHYRRTGIKPVIAPSSGAIERIRQWAGKEKRKIITVTLRESTYLEGRNSSIIEWQKFCLWADNVLGARVIVLRDFEKSLVRLSGPIGRYRTMPEAEWSLQLRAALYQESHLNLMVSNGPNMIAALLEGTRTKCFKMLNEQYNCTSLKFMQDRAGLKPGESHIWAQNFECVWEEDLFCNLKRHTESVFSVECPGERHIRQPENYWAGAVILEMN